MTAIELKDQLKDALKANIIEVFDESWRHKGHHGFSGQAGTHFRCFIVSELFEGKSLIERHQSVYACLPHVMGCDIHALSLQTLSVVEWAKKMGADPNNQCNTSLDEKE